jgi:signal transduction histidine kinase
MSAVVEQSPQDVSSADDVGSSPEPESAERSDSSTFGSHAEASPVQGDSAREDRARAAELLLTAVQKLSSARTREAVAQVVATTARALVAADGATFVLRDGDKCLYLDEDAIEPLWKGQRFLASSCVSGWVMENAEPLVMDDVYVDPRVPYAAYRPTFVKSLVMTPVRRGAPIAAIGTYWATRRTTGASELALLQELADISAVALENVAMYVELERRAHERTEQLALFHQEIDPFWYSAAHDLRSPLSAILGFAELIEDRRELLSTEQLGQFAGEIVLAGKRMNDLIGALLEFSRSARASLERAPLDLSTGARLIAERLVAASSRADGPVELVIEPGLRVHADAALFEVLLHNLLSNAIKYASKEARPRIAVGAYEDAVRGTSFFVRDNGVGFDPAHGERLFKPFQRLHTDRAFVGSGLGLATVARIVVRHGGSVWAEGAPGQGATFFFTLPHAS